MGTLVPVVEGDGELEAVPLLLRRILERTERWDWTVGKARKIGGIGKLRKEFDNLLQRLAAAPACDAILVLNDLDDGCPMTEALVLAEQARALALPCPVALVFAHREYEAWFLASLPTIVGKYDLPADLVYGANVEGPRDVKGWLTSKMPPGKIYKETTHQVKMTHLLDIDSALSRSRSFQRLYHAVGELLDATGNAERGYATPGLRPPEADRRGDWDIEL